MRITMSCSARLRRGQPGAVSRLHRHLELGGRRADLRRVCGRLPEHRRCGNDGCVHDYLRNSPMMAYLAMMAPRLVELHRVLKPTGSLYLYCENK